MYTWKCDISFPERLIITISFVNMTLYLKVYLLPHFLINDLWTLDNYATNNATTLTL